MINNKTVFRSNNSYLTKHSKQPLGKKLEIERRGRLFQKQPGVAHEVVESNLHSRPQNRTVFRQ